MSWMKLPVSKWNAKFFMHGSCFFPKKYGQDRIIMETCVVRDRLVLVIVSGNGNPTRNTFQQCQSSQLFLFFLSIKKYLIKQKVEGWVSWGGEAIPSCKGHVEGYSREHNNGSSQRSYKKQKQSHTIDRSPCQSSSTISSSSLQNNTAIFGQMFFNASVKQNTLQNYFSS